MQTHTKAVYQPFETERYTITVLVDNDLNQRTGCNLLNDHGLSLHRPTAGFREYQLVSVGTITLHVALTSGIYGNSASCVQNLYVQGQDTRFEAGQDHAFLYFRKPHTTTWIVACI